MDNDQYSFYNIDSLVFQIALQSRELSQKKNEINQQIKVCRADIAERRSYIETIHRNIEKLEEEIRTKQSAVLHNRANAESMKATNSLLLQYEQTLKAELESKKASYNHDMEAYKERIASYRKIFQLHKEYYCKNPLAQKLLRLHGEKEEIECRIKACHDQITMKQMELDHLIDPEFDFSSTEKLPDSISGQQPLKEPEKQLDRQTTEYCDSAVDIFSLQLNQTKMLQNIQVSVEVNAGGIHEEYQGQDTTACSPYPEEPSNELHSYEQLDEEMHTDEQEKEMEVQDQVLEQQSTVSEVEDTVEERVRTEDHQSPREEDIEGLTAFPQSSSQETNPQFSPAKMTPSTPTFPFHFSPTSSDAKSPAFLFSLNSDPSTPGFSGFGFDMGTSQDEDTTFAFARSFFSEKTSESKSSSCPQFLFGQSEQSEDFQFAFASKSPQTTNKDNTRDDFPFSFNF